VGRVPIPNPLKAKAWARNNQDLALSQTLPQGGTLMKSYSMLILAALCGGLCQGQATQPPADPIADKLFPPELVMQYRQEINLNDSQTRSIKDEIQKAQARFLDLQWDMESESEKLVKLLDARPVDESAVQAQVDKVLDQERLIKKTQISLLVRIKNLLTEDQQNKLMELRHKSP
jgi:Spy/CpxP family protein refolding chaperone